MMTRIKVEIKRDWQRSPYSGQLRNVDHRAALSDFEDAVVEKAKDESCAGILNNADMELMSEEYRVTLRNLIVGLEVQSRTDITSKTTRLSWL
jgi:hypothetical protein